MAFNITTNYAGEVHGRILTQMLQDAGLVSGGHVYVQGGIIDKYFIPQMDMTNVIQDRKAELDIQTDPVGDASFTEKVLEPEELMVFMKYNPRTFEQYWREYAPKGELVFKELPAQIQGLILQKVFNQVGHKLNYLLLNGDKSLPDNDTYMGIKKSYFDGFLTRIKASLGESEEAILIGTAGGSGASSTGAKTDLVADALDGTNVIDALESCKTAILANTALRMKYTMPGFKFFVSPVTADYIRQYQVNQTYKGLQSWDTGVMTFDGKPIVTMESMPEDAILGTVAVANESSNLWAGVNDMRDDSTIVSDRTAPYNETYFVKMLIDMGTQIPYLNECVYYDANLQVSS